MLSKELKRNICKWVLFVAVLFANPLHVLHFVHASAEINILQAYITGQTLTVFTDAELRSDRLRCLVSSRDVDITSSGSLSEQNVLVKTTILVDTSTSIPRATRGGVIEMLNKMVERKSTNEEFKGVAKDYWSLFASPPYGII